MPWDEPKVKDKKMFNNGEKGGMLLGMALLLFSIVTGDVPLGFFLFSFVLFEIRLGLLRLDNSRMNFLANFLLGLAISLCLGSVVMML